MAKLFERRGKKIIDTDSAYETVTIPLTGVETVICAIKCKTGAAAKLSKIGNAPGAGGEAYVGFTLYVNYKPHYKFINIKNMITDPANPDTTMAAEIDLPQGAYVELRATNADNSIADPTPSDFACTGRLDVNYEDPN